MGSLQIGGGKKEEAVSLWVKVSTIKLPSGVWERWQAGLSQRHPSKMGDGLLALT